MRLTEGDDPELRIVADAAIEEAVENALAAVERDPAASPVFLPAGLALVLETRSTALTFDYVDIGYRLASARMRAALALGDREVQYLPVDTDACPREVRAMDYRLLHLPHVADPFDHDRSDGAWEDVHPGPMGEWTPDAPKVRRWRLRLPEPRRGPKIAWRADFVAPAPLFQVSGMPWTLATQDLVDRLRSSGIDDVRLNDVAPIDAH